MSEIRVRFAPSPTGKVHIGNIRAAIYNWLYARLSLGGGRLFVRYVCERMRPDLRSVISEFRHEHHVGVSAWQMGPRDEVRVMGALGQCGRACCCASWQQKYPGGLTSDSLKGLGLNSAALNGICGRFKCCLAFERET